MGNEESKEGDSGRMGWGRENEGKVLGEKDRKIG